MLVRKSTKFCNSPNFLHKQQNFMVLVPKQLQYIVLQNGTSHELYLLYIRIPDNLDEKLTD